MYTIVQNYLMRDSYDYAHEYDTIEEARATIAEYEKEDSELGAAHSYTIVDQNYDDAEEKERALFDEMAMSAMQDMGLPEDEAEMMLEDFYYAI